MPRWQDCSDALAKASIAGRACATRRSMGGWRWPSSNSLRLSAWRSPCCEARHVVPRDQALEHPVNLARAAAHGFDDLGARQAMRLLGEQFQNVQSLVQ